ncbi:sensor histidine kinase [Streptomyces sp. WMMB 322]|uniref:sensor histidine kinase n=1 Tax=Streptomyces sp. WMMB 322 TaxID=1286821 RepID=UPI000823C8C4|nr:histidine kinase [Streptomyces sp. WMMB 322]SCK07531.1 Signal transduction histidine kinase [Streptomyces sp. WMMB 322]
MRTRRDWYADIALFLFAVVFSLVTADSVYLDEGVSRGERIADQVAGGVGCASVFLRRRWPVQLAVVLILAGTYFHYLTGATLAALFTVAVHRERRVTAWPAGIVLVQFVVFLVRSPQEGDAATGSALAYFALVAGAVGWGLYVRSRRALVASLEERARRAAEEARRQAREEIAREMHDVLAHRLSLLSVHAGALEFRPDSPAEEIRRASGVIRESAHQALQELREVIGVLRAPAADGPAEGEPEQPQPTLADVARLVEESREAGMRVSYYEDTEGIQAGAAGAGRTVYRVVQEGVTNARKHAPGCEVSVTVHGRPGRGVTVEVANMLPDSIPEPRRGPAVPGAGQGLIGLGERVALAGGRLEHGTEAGRFVLRVRLPGDERARAAGQEVACRP